MASALLTAFLNRNRTLLLDEGASGAAMPGAVAFFVVFVAPFLLVIPLFFLRDAEQRQSVWLASAVLAPVIGGLSIFSAGLLFLIVAGALGWAWWATRMGLEPACTISRASPAPGRYPSGPAALEACPARAGDQPTGLHATRGG